MKNSERIWDTVDTHAEDLVGMSDRIWGTPELLYNEYASAAEHTAMLRQKGFRVTENVAGMPTAMIGEAGEGGPVIAILGEYDALPGLSQEAGVAEHRPLEAGGSGHGCGHNLLGSAAVLAACGLKDWLEETGTPGRVRYVGCPAEEGGAAKTFMTRDGVFDDVDVAITWHPDTMSHVGYGDFLASTRMEYRFHGRASHAAAAPHLGRSALDAAEIMSVGVNYLREHVPQESRIHYAYPDPGGQAPNVVQATCMVRYDIRSTTLSGMRDLVERVTKCAEGAALMTGTTVEPKLIAAMSNMVKVESLADAMEDVMNQLGGIDFDEDDKAFAAEIQKTLTPTDIVNSYLRVGLKPRSGEALCDYVVPRDLPRDKLTGSTDVCDVSWAVPTIEARAATVAIGTPGHSWQITSQGKMPAAHKGMVWVAKVMAQTGQKLLTDETLLARVKKEHAEALAAEPYVCPIPEGVEPALVARPAAE